MKFLVLLAVVALGSANTLYNVQTEIRVDNDRITVRQPGKIVVIDKPKDDERGVQVFVTEHDKLIRRIKIDEDKNIVKDMFFSVGDELPDHFSEEDLSKEVMTTSSQESNMGKTGRSECSHIHGDNQMECLMTIFKKYEGVIREVAFEELLKDIKLAVDNNECHPVILKVLREQEVHTAVHKPVFHVWGLHWNVKEPARSFWGLKNTNRGRIEDNEKRTETFGTEHENQLTQEDQATRQIEYIKQLLKNRQEQQDDTLRTTHDSFEFNKHTDCSKNAMSKQLFIQNHIREIQGLIFQHQSRAQQLQLQQQHFNQQKHHFKLQMMAGHQRGMPYNQMKELNRAREVLQNKEQEILDKQKDLHLIIQKLHHELTKQQERLQQCLEDERKDDERLMGKMY